MPTLTAPLLLESGDRLTRAEFHRRYCAHPEIKKAELVEGVVYVGSPVRADVHGIPHSRIMTWHPRPDRRAEHTRALAGPARQRCGVGLPGIEAERRSESPRARSTRTKVESFLIAADHLLTTC